MRTPSYFTPEDTICPECGEPCQIVALRNEFDYAGTHCTHGMGGTEYPSNWGSPVSSCCEADMEDAYESDDLSEADLYRLGDDGPGYNWIENWRN